MPHHAPARASKLGPTLAFETLLNQLVERADEMARSQSRLRDLIRVNNDLTSNLDLATVLRRIVEIGTELIDARYGAIGVIADDQSLDSARPQTTEPQAPLAFATTDAAKPTEQPTNDLVIDVVGKVNRPGIVTVPKGSRVYEAIKAAGGVKGKVDTTALNMARVLTDGEQLLVGMEAAAVPGAATSGGAATTKINLNTATEEQLDTLPGVGPVTAQSILSWREENGRFTSIDDLLDVKGIGDATLSELRDLVVV